MLFMCSANPLCRYNEHQEDHHFHRYFEVIPIQAVTKWLAKKIDPLFEELGDKKA
jgi:hypothetical protein